MSEGRERIIGLLAAFLAARKGAPGPFFPDRKAMAQAFVSLLVEDLQIRRIVGHAGSLPRSCRAIRHRAELSRL